MDLVEGIFFGPRVLDIIHTGSGMLRPLIEVKDKIAITQVIVLKASSYIEADGDQEREAPGESAVSDDEVVELWQADNLINIWKD